MIGIKFVCLTDHASLVYLLDQQKLSRRQARWLDFLGEFKFVFSHIAGKRNVVADSLSHVPAASAHVQSAITLSDESFLLDVVRRS